MQDPRPVDGENVAAGVGEGGRSVVRCGVAVNDSRADKGRPSGTGQIRKTGSSLFHRYRKQKRLHYIKPRMLSVLYDFFCLETRDFM